jgi:hypothetical protein
MRWLGHCLMLAMAIVGCSAQTTARGAQTGSSAKLSNTLRWSTASEEEVFGFDVYRATRREGPFVRLTKTPVLAAGQSDTQQNYSFVDDAIVPEIEYFYYIEEISMSSERHRVTPVITAPAKTASTSND